MLLEARKPDKLFQRRCAHLFDRSKPHVIVHQREDLLGVLVGKTQPLTDGFSHAYADFHVIVEANTVARLRRGLERGWLAAVMKQNAPGQCWIPVVRQS